MKKKPLKEISLSHPRRKSLLITGGAGFIGSHFVDLAVKQGYTVVVLDALTYAGRRENLVHFQRRNQIELIVDTICNQDLVFKLLKKHEVSAVINFAAESHVDRSIQGPSLFVETNIRGTFSLLNGSLAYWNELPNIEKVNFRYLQVSTDEVYGTLGPQGKFSETSPYLPNSPYSASKAAGDHLVRAWYHTYGLPTLVTHCSNNYGPRQYPEKLIPTIITAALRNMPLPVYGNGLNIRDWIHVEDHCQGLLLALENGKKGSSYCFGGDSEKNNLEVVRTICRHLDKLRPLVPTHSNKNAKLHEANIQFVKDRLGHDYRYAIDDRLAQTELGFKRQFSFETGIAETVKWYVENQEWCHNSTHSHQSSTEKIKTEKPK